MKSALGIILLLTAQVQAIPFTHEFTGAISVVNVVGLDYGTSARDQLEQADLGRYAALSGDGLASAIWSQDTIVDVQNDQLMSHGAKQKVPDFGGTALLFLLSSGLLIAINHRRSPPPAAQTECQRCVETLQQPTLLAQNW